MMFDKSFFHFLAGFAAILVVAIGTLAFLSYYSTVWHTPNPAAILQAFFN